VIIRARHFYLPPPRLRADAWDGGRSAERVIRWVEEDHRRRLPRPQGEDRSRPLHARIDAGRWVAQCECLSAQIIDPDDPFFFCVECLNAVSDGKWRPLLIPADVPAVEAAVEQVDRPQDRWWWANDDPHPGNPRRPVRAPEPPGTPLGPAAADTSPITLAGPPEGRGSR
jgi:hypothetical protein